MGFFDGFKKFRKEKSRGGHGRKPDVVPTADMIQSDWRQIDVLLSQKGPSQLKQALLTAHKAFDNTLKDKFSGENIPERLKEARDSIEPGLYDRVWKAHRMRNALVHESGYEPPAHMVTSAVETLRDAMRALGVNL